MIVHPLAVLWDALCEGRPATELQALCLACQTALPEALHPALWAHAQGLWVAARLEIEPSRVYTATPDGSFGGLRRYWMAPPPARLGATTLSVGRHLLVVEQRRLLRGWRPVKGTTGWVLYW